MASLLVAATLLTHSAIKTHHQKRKTRRANQTTTFTALERENATRIATLQSTTPFCHHSDSPPLYTHHAHQGDGYAAIAEGMPPGYHDGDAPVSASQIGGSMYVYRRGREDGFMAKRPVGRGEEEEEGVRVPSAMGEEEVRRINVERRKGMKARAVSRLVRRWRRGGVDRDG